MKYVLSLVLNNFQNDSRVLKEAISLNRNGYKVVVAALYEDGLKTSETISGIEVVRIKLITKKWSKKRIVQVFKYIELSIRVIKKFKKFHVFHCHDLGALPIGVLAKILNPSIKIVYDAHEYETELKGLKGFEKILKKFLEKRLIGFSSKVITVSDSIANAYQELYKINKPVVIYNCPNFYSIKEKRNLFRSKFNIPDSKLIFLYQGGLAHGRGIEHLVEAFQLLGPNFVCVFMGNGPLIHLVKKAQSQTKNIYHHEAVSPLEVLDYTSSADVGIVFTDDSCLNHTYCLPNKFFEYLMAGIPVITSNLKELKIFVDKYNLGLYPSENSLNGLLELLNRIESTNLANFDLAIESFKKIYNWENQEEKLLKLYSEL